MLFPNLREKFKYPILWNLELWMMRHNIYLANELDQTIYFGYFYE